MSGGADTAISENRKSHFGSYLYRASLLMNHEVYFIPQVANGEDLIFKYCAFFAANQIEYCSQRIYVYRANQYSVTNNLEKQAVKYYDVLLLGWTGLADWLAQRERTSDCMRMIAFARKRINCTCMYAARNYCIWHNGSFLSFKREIIDGLLPERLIQPVEYDDDASLARDYKCLLNNPGVFFAKFYLRGIGDKMKWYVKKAMGLSASR